MDITNRRITKIAREVEKLAVCTMKVDGIGTAEFDLIHFVRHHPGCTQADIREALNMDKGAAARRTANLEEKGFLERRENPVDGRSRLLYATPEAERFKLSRVMIESVYYEWMMSGLSDEDRTALARILEEIGRKATAESRAGFPNVSRILEDMNRQGEEQRDSHRPAEGTVP